MILVISGCLLSGHPMNDSYRPGVWDTFHAFFIFLEYRGRASSSPAGRLGSVAPLNPVAFRSDIHAFKGATETRNCRKRESQTKTKTQSLFTLSTMHRRKGGKLLREFRPAESGRLYTPVDFPSLTGLQVPQTTSLMCGKENHSCSRPPSVDLRGESLPILGKKIVVK